MKILFVWRKYDQVVGGVERMSIALMNEMARRGHDIALLSWDREGAKSYYEMDPRIQWFKLEAQNIERKAGFLTRIKRMMKIRKIVKNYNPDIVMAFMDGAFLSVKLSVLGLDLPVVEAERCSVARFEYLRAGRFSWMIFQSLRLAKNITVQLESYRNDYPEYLRKRIVSIPNPVFEPGAYASPGDARADKVLLSVGRLSYQKNFPVLLNAFDKLANEFPDWTLKVIGDGEDRPELEKRVAAMTHKNRVFFVGAVRDVSPHYIGAHLFCLPSRWEGFPNALAEALAHGLPAVGFQDCLGVRDLIHHEKNGLLATGMGDTDALAEALRVLMTDNIMRERMGVNAADSMKPYRPQAIFDQWENFFLRAAV
jgi:glycosyltransferase involved in cell wall biosynthesis